jgi:hypothetical protein
MERLMVSPFDELTTLKKLAFLMPLAILSTLLIKIRGPAGRTANDGGGFKACNGMSLTGSESEEGKGCAGCVSRSRENA